MQQLLVIRRFVTMSVPLQALTMPGYESSRFVDASPELRDMTCSICRHILCRPLVTKCCQSTYCESCLKNWLASKKTCPADKKPLKFSDGVHNAPTAIAKILKRQRIKCAMASKGCQEIVLLKNIEAHEKSCQFCRFNCCSECGFELGKHAADHKCLASIIEYKSRVIKELGDTNQHIGSVVGQIDAAVRVIRDLTRAGQQVAAPSNSRRVCNNRELLAEIRKHIDKGRVDGHTTAKPVVEKVVEVVKDAIANKGDKIYEVTKAIKDTLEAHFLGDWNIYLLWNNIGYFFHSVHQDGFVELKFNKATVAVYRSVESFGFTRLVSLFRAGLVCDFAITKTGFDDTASNEIVKIALQVLKRSVDCLEFANLVTAELMKNYGSTWHCFIHKANYAFFNVRSDKGRFIMLSNSECKIVIFQ